MFQQQLVISANVWYTALFINQVYVEEMQKYIDIDIYGDCGPLDCPKRAPCEKDFEVCLHFSKKMVEGE